MNSESFSHQNIQKLVTLQVNKFQIYKNEQNLQTWIRFSSFRINNFKVKFTSTETYSIKKCFKEPAAERVNLFYCII